MKHPEMLPKSRFASVAPRCSFTRSDFFCLLLLEDHQCHLLHNGNGTNSVGRCSFLNYLLLFALNRSNMGIRIGLLLWHFSFFFESFHVDIRSMIFSYSFCVCHQQNTIPAGLRIQRITDEASSEDFRAELMEPRCVCRDGRVTVNFCSTQNYSSTEWSFIQKEFSHLPINLGCCVAFHRFSPRSFIENLLRPTLLKYLVSLF